MKTPRPYQSAVIETLCKHDTILADECGLGKTLTSLLAVNATRYDRVLIIAPKRVIPQWIEEIEEQFGTPPTFVPYGVPAYLISNDPSGIWVTSYETARTDLSLTQWVWTWLIVDEAHRIKNRSAKQTKAIKHIQAVRKLALTGTPQEKSPADLWSLLNFINPNVFSSYWSFYNLYVDSKQTYTGFKKVVGVKNPASLGRLLRRFMVRRVKKDVEPDLPPRIEIEVTVPMNERQADAYREVDHAKDVLVSISNGDGDARKLLITTVLAKIVRLQQIVSWPPILELDIESEKVNWVMDWLEDNPDETVVIFTKFRATALHIHASTSSDIIIGGVHEQPEAFLSGQKRIVVGTIAAMGEGLNLQRATSAIFVDQEWSTIKMGQAIDRVHRLGIDSPRNIYYLVGGKVDSLVMKALQNKWTDIELVMAYLKEQEV